MCLIGPDISQFPRLLSCLCLGHFDLRDTEIKVNNRKSLFLLAEKWTACSSLIQLNSFAAEVTRVAREVGTEGKLGGQASERCGWLWKDLTDNVNSMAGNLTSQVRGIAGS